MFLFGALVTGIASRVALSIDSPGELVTVVAAALPAYLAADLASGSVHWFCDTFFAEDSPVIGRTLIFGFREHHRDPEAMTRHGFFEVNGSNSLALLPLLWFTWTQQAPIDGEPDKLFAPALVALFAGAVFATNQFHKWAHARQVPTGVAWLQQWRLILSPAHHDLHHQIGHGRAYCVTTGWLNPCLDRIRLFHRLETAVRGLGLRRALHA